MLRKNVLDNNRINATLDSLVNDIGVEALNRNFQRFNILNVAVWPNAYVGGSHAKEMVYLKNWLRDRIKWIDGQFGYGTNVVDPDPVPEATSLIYPNPAGSTISMTLDSSYDHFEVYDFFGRIMANVTLEFKQNQEIQVHIGELDPGMYVLKVFYSNRSTVHKFVKQ